jgi:hypothetical protein
MSGGLEFIEVCAKLTDNTCIETLKPYVKKFANFNNINIVFVETMPKIIIGKTIFIEYDKKNHWVTLKALHTYYDGISFARFFNELDTLYHGNELTKKFKFKTPLKSKYSNMIVELGANIVMSKINAKEKPKKITEVEPYMIFENISSGDLIREIQKKENLDMVLLINNRKIDNNNNDHDMKNDLTFRYINKDEDFKHVLANSSKIDQALRFSKWLINKPKILFLNNLSSIKLPSFIECLVCNEEPESKMNNKLLTLVAYPKTSDNKIHVYKA